MAHWASGHGGLIMKVKITKPAQRRLEKINGYYDKSGNKSKGRKLRKAIAEKSKLLSEYPDDMKS